METLLRILEVAIGVGLVIFVHELGHFLAAKAVGIRVERFSLGFPPRLLGFRWGETDYCLSAIPLGGYVKMVGENPDEDDPDDERSFANKTVAQRSLVISAGVIMNVIFALVGFLVAFKLGVEMKVPVVGSAAPGSAADGKLERGDRIVSIDGETPLDFVDVAVGAAFADGEIDVVVERRGEQKRIVLEPRRDLGQQIQLLGITPIEEIAAVEEGSAAAAAGLHPGDRLVSLAPRPELQLVIAYGEQGADAGLRLVARVAEAVESLEGVSSVSVSPEEGGALVAAQIASTAVPEEVLAAANEAVEASAAEEGGSGPGQGAVAAGAVAAGARVESMSLAPAETGSLAGILASLASTPGQARTVTVWRDGAYLDVEVVPEAKPVRDLGLDMDNAPVVMSVVADEPAEEAGLEAGDIIRSIDGQPASIHTIVAQIKGLARADANSNVISFGIERGGEEQTIEVHPHRRESGPVIGAAFGIAVVRDVQPGSPAAAAGIEPGSRLVSIDGRESWFDEGTLRAIASDVEPGAELAVSWRTPAGEEREASIKPATVEGESRGELGAGFTLATFTPPAPGLLAPLRLGFDRTWVFMEQVFLTLQGMFTQKIDSSTLGGPITIANQAYHMTEAGVGTLLYFLCVISINLAVLNIMPIPILDGGHLVFLIAEAIKGSPVSVRVQNVAQTVGLVLIVLLIIFVTKNDITRLLT